MRPKFITLALILFSYFVPACGQLKWSKDISIMAQNDGGMKPQSNYVQITDSACLYIYFHYPKRDSFYFSLSKAEKDSLVKRMNNADFEKMNSQKRAGIIYDYPETSITLTQNGKFHRAGISGTEALPESVSEKFFNLYSYIMDLAKRKTQKPDQ
jgi:hypothetical protein